MRAEEPPKECARRTSGRSTGSATNWAWTVTVMNNRIADIRAEQRAQWEAGNRIPIESLIDRHPEIRGEANSIIDLIYSEVLLREELGETVRWEEYCQR